MSRIGFPDSGCARKLAHQNDKIYYGVGVADDVDVGVGVLVGLTVGLGVTFLVGTGVSVGVSATAGAVGVGVRKIILIALSSSGTGETVFLPETMMPTTTATITRKPMMRVIAASVRLRSSIPAV